MLSKLQYSLAFRFISALEYRIVPFIMMIYVTRTSVDENKLIWHCEVVVRKKDNQLANGLIQSNISNVNVNMTYVHGQPRAAEVQVRVCVSVQQAPRNNKDNYLPLRMNESENEWSNGWSKKIKCLPQAAAFPVQRLFVHTPMILGRQLLHGVVTTQGPHVPPE